MERTFAAFREEVLAEVEQYLEGVRGSLEEHAERKGYSDSGVDGENWLYDEGIELGDEPGHSWGEFRYKIREWFHEPRSVLPIKGGAWMFLVWRATPRFRRARGLEPEATSQSEAEQVSRCVR